MIQAVRISGTISIWFFLFLFLDMVPLVVHRHQRVDPPFLTPPNQLGNNLAWCCISTWLKLALRKSDRDSSFALYDITGGNSFSVVLKWPSKGEHYFEHSLNCTSTLTRGRNMSSIVHHLCFPLEKPPCLFDPFRSAAENKQMPPLLFKTLMSCISRHDVSWRRFSAGQ